MARRRSSFIKVRKGRVRLTPKGVKVTRPSYRIGGKNSWVNVSSKGVSRSVKTPLGTWNSRTGCSMPLGCLLTLIVPVLLIFLVIPKKLRHSE